MTEDVPLLQIENLTVDFPVGRKPLFGQQAQLRAVDRVSLEMTDHQTLGVVGESGSGKTTLARSIVGLNEVSGGSIRFHGEELTDVSSSRLKELRSSMQMVFQDPYSSLDPSWRVEDIVGEPLTVHERGLSKSQRRDRVLEAIRRVGLEHYHLERYPHEFSGGQRQRVAIARAIVVRPSFILFDEAVSSLDVSIRSAIINLIREIQNDLGTAYFFIAHDLALVRHISDRIAVMYLGNVVEEGPAKRVYEQPAHPYTEALLSAVTNVHAKQIRERIVLTGEIPSPLNPPGGCRFHTRCPYVMDVCRTVEPEPHSAEGGGAAACHLHTEGPKLGGHTVLGFSPTEMNEVLPQTDGSGAPRHAGALGSRIDDVPAAPRREDGDADDTR